MNEIKYTTDGKKVIVLGSLNSQEKIVQEIFLSNGIEIPSGENFVVKSLHDNPVVSWHQKREDELNKRIDSLKKQESELQNDLDKKKRRIRELGETASTQLNWIAGFLKEANEDCFEKLRMFIDGRVKFLVSKRYDLEIKSFEEFMTNEYGMKLLSLFGKDKGTLSFAVGRYSDGSGSWHDDIVVPAETYEEAISILQIELDRRIEENKKCDIYDIKASNKYGLKINDEYLSSYYKKEREQVEKQILEYSNNITKQQTKLLEIDNKLAK